MKKRFVMAAMITAVAASTAMTPIQAEAAEKTVDIKQIYQNMTVTKLPNGLVVQLPCRPGQTPPVLPPQEKPEVTPPETEKPPVAPPEAEKPPVTPPEAEKPPVTPPVQELTLAEQVVKLVNEERAKAGLQPLEIQQNVTDAANVRAREIKTSFSHTRPNGQSAFSALKEQGVNYRGAGENIAWGQRTPEEVMEGWMNSEGHRANILNAKFTKIGVGHYRDENGRNYWTQMFIY